MPPEAAGSGVNARSARWAPAVLALLMWAAALGLGTVRADTPSADEPGRVVMGVYAYLQSTEVLAKLAPFQEHLKRSLAAKGFRVEVELRIFPTYGEGIDALVEGTVDFSRLGPVSYVLSKERKPDIRLLAMESNEGSKRFNGVISVRKDSPIRSVEDLRGKTVAFGDRRSTTGRFLSQAALVRAGIRAPDLAGYAYLGRHDKVVFAVGAGNYDAGASNENSFHKYAEQKGLRKLMEFPCVTKPWVARAGLDPALFDALRESLLELSDPRILGPISRSGFLPAEDADYDLIREAMEEARAFDTQGLTFGVYASEKPSEVYSETKPTLDLVEAGLAAQESLERFQLKVFSQSREGIDALVRGDVDVVSFGASSYVLAKRMNPHVQLVARENAAAGVTDGVFVVPVASTVESLRDLRAKTVAFGDLHSTSGRFAAQVELLRAGLTGKDLQGYSYLGRHDRVAYAVVAGNYDAGVLRADVLSEDGLASKLRVIGRFSVPGRVWVAREGLDDELVEMLREALIGAKGNPSAEGGEGHLFAPVDDSAYDELRESMRLAEVFEQHP